MEKSSRLTKIITVTQSGLPKVQVYVNILVTNNTGDSIQGGVLYIGLYNDNDGPWVVLTNLDTASLANGSSMTIRENSTPTIQLDKFNALALTRMASSLSRASVNLTVGGRNIKATDVSQGEKLAVVQTSVGSTLNITGTITYTD